MPIPDEFYELARLKTRAKVASVERDTQLQIDKRKKKNSSFRDFLLDQPWLLGLVGRKRNNDE